MNLKELSNIDLLKKMLSLSGPAGMGGSYKDVTEKEMELVMEEILLRMGDTGKFD